MRSHSFDYAGLAIQFPDEISFSFNKEIIVLSGQINTNWSITITITANGKVITDTRKVHSNPHTVDISYHLQQLFNILLNSYISTPPNTGLNVAVRVDITDNVAYSTSYNFNTYCIWGAISPGEIFNPSREIPYFKAFPFTFTVYTGSPSTVWRSVDGGSFVAVTTTNIGLNNLNISGAGGAQREAIYRIGGTGDDVINTFDYTFDYTFRLKPGIAPDNTIKLLVNDCSEGVYLRWIDRQGFYQFYLFSQRNITFQTTNDGEAVDMDYGAFGRYFRGVSRQNKLEAQTVGGYAALVTPNVFYMLTSLFTSPIVWMYVSSDEDTSTHWLPVTVTAGSNVMTAAALQDMNINIVLPATQVQRL